MTQSTTETTNDRSRTTPLSDSDWHEVMSVERRRILLDVLDDRPTPIDLDALARAVETRENGSELETVQQVAITLHHNHLPKLAELAVVEYDPETRIVESFRDDL